MCPGVKRILGLPDRIATALTRNALPEPEPAEKITFLLDPPHPSLHSGIVSLYPLLFPCAC